MSILHCNDHFGKAARINPRPLRTLQALARRRSFILTSETRYAIIGA
jgi:hypothetical protein